MNRSGVIAAFALAACSLDSNGPQQALVTPTSVTLTLTGALTGTYTAQAVLTLDTRTNQGTWSLAGPQTLNGAVINGTIAFTGAPTARDYVESDVDALTTFQVTPSITPSGQLWVAFVQPSLQPVGAYTLTLTSVSAGVPLAIGQTYVFHGTLDATLRPTGVAVGTVTMHGTF